jgi:alkyl hydroperoxide reductase subunit AhpC
MVFGHILHFPERNLHFPLLSDFEPKGSVARKYGVYRQQEGTTERALFVIDSDGVIRWSYVSPIGINLGAEGILKALESLAEPSKKED